MKKSETKFVQYINRYGGIWLTGLVLLLGTALVMSTQFYPRADQRTLLICVSQFHEGDYSALARGGYIHNFPNQKGIVLLFYGLSFLFGDNTFLAVQLINVPAIAATYLIMARIAGMLWNGRGQARLGAYLVCLLFVPYLFYSTFVYGNILSQMFCIFAVYEELLYFKSRKAGNLLLSVIGINLAVVLKSNALIFLIAMLIFLVYDIVVSSQGRWLSVGGLALALLLWLAAGKAVDGTFERMSGYPAEEGIPTIGWVTMGMQEGKIASGWWNSYYPSVYKDCNYDPELAKQLYKENLKKSLDGFANDPAHLVNFMAKKVASQWNNPTFEGFNVMRGRQSALELSPLMQSMTGGRGKTALMYYLNYFQTMVLAGALIYFCSESKNGKSVGLLLALTFVGGFLFHLFWEAKCQYTIAYFILLIPYSVCGYLGLMRRLDGFGKSLKRVGEDAGFRRKVLIRAGICLAGFALLMFLSRTYVFSRVIGLNDDNETYYYYLRQDWDDE